MSTTRPGENDPRRDPLRILYDNLRVSKTQRSTFTFSSERLTFSAINVSLNVPRKWYVSLSIVYSTLEIVWTLLRLCLKYIGHFKFWKFRFSYLHNLHIQDSLWSSSDFYIRSPSFSSVENYIPLDTFVNITYKDHFNIPLLCILCC